MAKVIDADGEQMQYFLGAKEPTTRDAGGVLTAIKEDAIQF